MPIQPGKRCLFHTEAPTRRWPCYLLVCFIPLLLLPSGCRRQRKAETAPSIAVYLEKVKQLPLQKPLIVIGTTEAKERSLLSFQVNGIVEKVFVEQGQAVKAKTPLASLDKESIKLNLELTRRRYYEAIATYRKYKKGYRTEVIKQRYSAYKQALALYQKAAISLKRIKRLHQQKAASDEQLTQAQSAYRSARAQKNSAFQAYKMYAGGYDKSDVQVAGIRSSQANTQYKLAKKQLKDTVLLAPFQGVIAKRSAHVGELVAAGRTAFELLDISKIRIQLGVPEKLISALYVGQKATVLYGPNQPIGVGTLTQKGVVIDKATYTYPVEVTIKNPIVRYEEKQPIYKILPGKIVVVVFQRKIEKKGILLPIQAVLDDGSEKYVFVNDKGRAKRVKVTTTGTSQNRLIVQGLKAGDEVVVSGQHQLFDKRKLFIVRRKEQKAEISFLGRRR